MILFIEDGNNENQRSNKMHIVKQDTFTIGISWLEKELYGEGGLEIHLGKYIICFWRRVE
jgi:hypothetical protein